MGSQNRGMRTFHLHRTEDTWLTVHKSMAIYDSLAEMEAIHGHDGRTKIVWDDEKPAEKAPKKTVLDQ